MNLLNTTFKQKNDWTCGPAVLRLILHWYFGRPQSVDDIVRELKITRRGTEDRQLIRMLAKNGVKYRTKENARLTDIRRSLAKNLVVIAYWIPRYKEGHYSIVKKVDSRRIYFHDTWFGSRHSYALSYFTRQCWRDKEYRRLFLIPK
jgi:predicted double-glycine peptidase